MSFKTKNRKLVTFFFILAFLFTAVNFCLAQTSTTSLNISIPNPLKGEDFEAVAGSVLSALEAAIGGIAITVFIIAGMVYIFSQGNDQRMETAKRIMTAAVIGLALVLAGRTFIKELYQIFGNPAPSGTEAAADAASIVTNVMNLILSVLGMIGIISLVWSGILYLTSAGDEEQMERGKKQMIYSIIGLIIAIGALVIVKQVNDLLT